MLILHWKSPFFESVLKLLQEVIRSLHSQVNRDRTLYLSPLTFSLSPTEIYTDSFFPFVHPLARSTWVVYAEVCLQNRRTDLTTVHYSELQMCQVDSVLLLIPTLRLRSVTRCHILVGVEN
jgi:hypothetical protein